jgi:hypothetical protein
LGFYERNSPIPHIISFFYLLPKSYLETASGLTPSLQDVTKIDKVSNLEFDTLCLLLAAAMLGLSGRS